MTIEVAPFLKASFGVITLFWSCFLSPGNLIPGVTMNRFLYFFLTIFASFAEHTIPAAPDFFMREACFNTNRQCIGSEINEDYAKESLERMKSLWAHR